MFCCCYYYNFLYYYYYYYCCCYCCYYHYCHYYCYYYYYYYYFSFQSQPVAQLGVRYVAVHCTGASRALEPHGQVSLRIAANLRPTQLVKRMVQNFKQEVAEAETPLAHTLWACRPPPAGTLAHCPADTSLYWVLAKMMAARETNSAPIHSSNRVQNLIKVQSQDVFRCTKV